MYVVEFFILFIVVTIEFFASLLSFISSQKSPIIEFKLFSLFFITNTFSLILQLPIFFLSSPSWGLDSLGLELYTFSAFWFSLSFLFMQLALFYPSFKFDYIHTFYLILLVVIDSATFFNTEFIFQSHGDFLVFSPGDISQILFSLVLGSIILLVLLRLNQIRKITSDRSFFLFSPKYYTLVVILIFSNFIISTLYQLGSSIQLPGLLDYIPIAILYLMFSYALYKKNYFLFMIPVKLYAITITEKQSGLVLYSINFDSAVPAEELLGSLFNALNLSLKDTIKTKRDMEEISFGDKIISLSPGKKVTTALITSERALMTNKITNYLTNTFEKKFGHVLQNEDYPTIDSSEFNEFRTYIDLVKQYFALTN